MIKRFTLHGHSMEPNFYDGDKLLVSSVFFKLKKGDVIVFSSGGRNYLKRITAAASNSYVVVGDNTGHGRSWNISKNQIKGKFLTKY